VRRLATTAFAVVAFLATAGSGVAAAASVNINAGLPFINGEDGWILSGEASANLLVYEPDVTVTVVKLPYSPGDPVLATGSDSVEAFTGNWSAVMHNAGPTHILPEGEYRATMGQQPLPPYLLTGMGGVSASADFHVDRTGPDTTITTAPDDPTANTAATFTFTAVDSSPGSGVAGFECSVDGAAWAACGDGDGNPSAGQISFTAAEGHRGFRVRAIDRVGNIEPAPATFNWLVDLTDPEVHLPPVGQDANENVTPSYILGSSPAPSGSCNDPLGGSPAGASGIAICNIDPVNTSQFGNFARTAHAEDRVGHTADARSAYRVVPPRYRNLVSQDDPIAWYRLDDSSGSASLADSSGNGRAGDAKNGVVLDREPAIACHLAERPAGCEVADDIRGRAAFFNGKGAQGRVDNIAAPKSFTLEAWVRPFDDGRMMVVQHGGSGALWIESGKAAFRSSFNPPVTGGPTLQPGRWVHLAGTWSGGTGRLYVNGQLAASGAMPSPPSGTSTFYLGYGDQAPWLHGELDEVAYYDRALSGSRIALRNMVGRYHETPSAPGGPDTTRPEIRIAYPQQDGTYVPTKAPDVSFACSDPDGPADVASCVATVDGSPIANGDPLPDTPGPHQFKVVATSQSGLVFTRVHRYTITGFEQVVAADNPVAHYRFDEAPSSAILVDRTGRHNGLFRNDTAGGPVGISGDGSATRAFFGKGGYAYVNGLAASPDTGSTLEAWVKPDDTGDMAILEHGGAGQLFIRDGRVVFRHVGSEIQSAPGAAPAGRMTQVAGVWDGVDLVLYLDGTEAARREAPDRPSGSAALMLGLANAGLVSPWLRGSLDEVSIYDRGLSAARIDQHFRADPPPETDRPQDTDPSGPDGPVGSDDPSGDDQTGGGTDTAGTGEIPDGAEPVTGLASGKAAEKARAKRVAIKRCRQIGKSARRKRCLRRANIRR